MQDTARLKSSVQKASELTASSRFSLIYVSNMARNSLLVLMVILSILVSLSIGVGLLVNKTMSLWITDIVNEVTVEIRPVVGLSMSNQTKEALKILSKTPGIGRVKVLDKEKNRQLLKPWLGETDIIDELPLPQLISVVVADTALFNADLLSEVLTQNVVGASLDSHDRWQNELKSFGNILNNVSFLVISLVVLTVVIITVFATRAVMTGSSQIIEVLSLIGATNSFIIYEVAIYFLRMSVLATLIGVIPCIMVFILFGNFYDTKQSLFINFIPLGVWEYVIVFLSSPLIAFITLMTASLTSRSILTKIKKIH